MTLDWIDRAFVARADRPVRIHAAPSEASDATASPPERPATTAPSAPAADGDARRHDDAEASDREILERLLTAVPEEWRALADSIDTAASSGRRVVAVTGVGRGEGRSTVVAGLAAVLRARGRSVAVVDRSPLFLAGDAARTARAADVVLVDAGPWFQPGPVRRGAVERAALGCDGVLLVRRDDSPPCPARERVLEAIGLVVVGEAVTFAAAS